MRHLCETLGMCDDGIDIDLVWQIQKDLHLVVCDINKLRITSWNNTVGFGIFDVA